MSEARSTRDGGDRVLAAFPPGEAVLEEAGFDADIFSRVDDALAAKRCPDGRLEIETSESRLTCLVHRSLPLLAGLQERHVFSRIPLRELAQRADEMEQAVCRLVSTDTALALVTAVHFCKQPMLRSSTRLVDPAHVLKVLEHDREDAAVAFERAGARTLLFLHQGIPARIYFGSPAEDPGVGDARERFLGLAFDSRSRGGRLEVFTDLKLPVDPDAGSSLRELAAAAKPPPPVMVQVALREGREVTQRPFSASGVVIGRDPSCEIVLDNLAVSRRHAKIVWEKGRFVVEDLGSANGTRLDGLPVERESIGPDGYIDIAKFRITLAEQRQAPGFSETMLLNLRPPVTRAELEWDGGSVALEGGVLVGKSDRVDARARGFFVRRVHARVESRGDGRFDLTCFGNATASVDGRKVSEAQLRMGDRFTVGKTDFRISGG